VALLPRAAAGGARRALPLQEPLAVAREPRLPAGRLLVRLAAAQVAVVRALAAQVAVVRVVAAQVAVVRARRAPVSWAAQAPETRPPERERAWASPRPRTPASNV
jgi:hypothetical protein